MISGKNSDKFDMGVIAVMAVTLLLYSFYKLFVSFQSRLERQVFQELLREVYYLNEVDEETILERGDGDFIPLLPELHLRSILDMRSERSERETSTIRVGMKKTKSCTEMPKMRSCLRRRSSEL
ncbi:hypothetical protein JTB14_028523 [Gonioctena quinquepunctata]|nr:hypothetical protein JTB14_028523 [Gonioctena quinquepunctata]